MFSWIFLKGISHLPHHSQMWLRQPNVMLNYNLKQRRFRSSYRILLYILLDRFCSFLLDESTIWSKASTNFTVSGVLMVLGSPMFLLFLAPTNLDTSNLQQPEDWVTTGNGFPNSAVPGSNNLYSLTGTYVPFLLLHGLGEVRGFLDIRLTMSSFRYVCCQWDKYIVYVYQAD